MSKTPSAQRLFPLEQPPGAPRPIYRALRDLTCAGCTVPLPIGSLHTRTSDRAGRIPGLRYPWCARCQPLSAPGSSATALESPPLPELPPESEVLQTVRPTAVLASAVLPLAPDRVWPPVTLHLRTDQTLPDPLPQPSGELVLHVALLGVKQTPGWGALLLEDGLERLGVYGPLDSAPHTLARALQHADAWYARLRLAHGWPALTALSCPRRGFGAQHAAWLSAPLIYTPNEHPNSRGAMLVAQRWALEPPLLTQSIPPTRPDSDPTSDAERVQIPDPLVSSVAVRSTPLPTPAQADVLIFVDYSGHPTLGAPAWGAVFVDLVNGREFEAFGPLGQGSEAAALEAALAWLRFTLRGREATVFNDAMGCHAAARERGLDVRYLPREAPMIRRAHTLAKKYHRALLAWQGALPGVED